MIRQEKSGNPIRKRLAAMTGLLFALSLVLQPAALAAEVVQIAAPSAAGVSHNRYPQFDVGPGGLVLNNSPGAVQTQLAGAIAGNANLGVGPARIILNEVTGTSVSQLRGMIEVAGQRAEVVIANPNGIVVDGAGFINTSRAVLTTGRPVFGGSGSLTAFRVSGGQIAVQGAGLAAAGLDRVDLISRTMAINADVRAKEINAVAGANTVNYDTLNAKRLYGAGQSSEVAIDVGALGGMYAGKIKLVATDRGVGVNSQGTFEATGGDIVITSNGKVKLANQTSATGAIAVSAQAIDLSGGMMSAVGDISLKARQGDIVNSNGGSVSAVGSITVTTPGAFVNSQGFVSAVGDFTIKAAAVDNSQGGGILAGGNLAITLGETGSNNSHNYGYGSHYGYGGCGGGYNPPAGTAGTFNNSGGFVSTGGDLTLTVKAAAAAPTATPRYVVDNSAYGYMNAGNNLTITVTADAGKERYGAPATGTVYAVNNTDGIISAGNDLSITAQDAGVASSGQSVSVNCTDPHNPPPAPVTKTNYFVNNTRGLMSAGNDIVLTVQGASGSTQISRYSKKKYDRCDDGKNPPASVAVPYTIDNTDGTIAALGDLVITTKGAVNNSDGQLTAGESAAVTANAVQNGQGLISGDASVAILTLKPFDVQAGQVISNGPIVIPNI